MHRVPNSPIRLMSTCSSTQRKAGRLLLVAVLIGLVGWLPARAAGPAQLVSDINQTGGGPFIPNNSSSPHGLTAVGSTLYFSADDGTRGSELWKSDGTAAGTVLVKDIYAGAPDSSPNSLANMNGTLLFAANDGVSGRELWKSRGTATTTVLVQNIASGAGDSAPAGFTIMGTDVFFSASDDTTGTELWSIPIDALNFAPTASSLTIATPLNTPVSSTLTASDPEGSPLTFSIVTNGRRGLDEDFLPRSEWRIGVDFHVTIPLV